MPTSTRAIVEVARPPGIAGYDHIITVGTLLQELAPAALSPADGNPALGPGEQLVFEPYSKEVYEETFKWIADHGIFADSGMGSGNYEESVIRAA